MISPGPTALPAQDVPAPRVVTGRPTARAASMIVPSFLDRPRPGDGARHDPVERGVGGVQGPGQIADVDRRAEPLPPEGDVSSATSSGSATVAAWTEEMACSGRAGYRPASITAAKARPRAA